MKSTDEILAAIDDTIDDWEVGPDAVRYNAPAEARQPESSSPDLEWALDLLRRMAAAYAREFDHELAGVQQTTDSAYRFDLRHRVDLEPVPVVSLIPAPMTHHPRWAHDADTIRRALDNPNAHTLVVPHDRSPAAMFAIAEMAPTAAFPTEILTRHRFADQDTTWLAYIAPDGSHVAGPAQPRPDRG